MNDTDQAFVNEQNHPSVIEVYSIYDNQTGIFDTPFFTKDIIAAKRHFIMVARQERSVIRNFIDDFSLHYLGTMSIKSGMMYPCEETVEVLTGLDLLDQDIFDGENALILPEDKQ